MNEECVINVDLADVWKAADRKELIRTLAWGDQVTVAAKTASALEVEFVDFIEQDDGSVLPKKSTGAGASSTCSSSRCIWKLPKISIFSPKIW